MNERQILIAVSLIFLLTQGIGLYAASQYITFIDIGVAKPAFEDPHDITVSFFFFFYILVLTGIIILVIKYKKKLLTVFEGIAVFFASAVAFDLLIPYSILNVISVGAILAAILTYYKLAKPCVLSQNLALIFSVIGVGALLGVSLSVLPVLIFMLLLSIYDFAAVFWTKHMVYMAKAITEKPRAFTAAFPFKGRVKGKGKKMRKIVHTFHLGGGDLVIPLIFSVSVLRFYGIIPALCVVLASMIALLLLFSRVLKRPGQALPALPPICAGASIGFIIGVLLL